MTPISTRASRRGIGSGPSLEPGRRDGYTPTVGETRVDLVHLLEDLRDAYPGALEETILTEVVANALDSGAGCIGRQHLLVRGCGLLIDDVGGIRHPNDGDQEEHESETHAPDHIRRLARLARARPSQGAGMV